MTEFENNKVEVPGVLVPDKLRSLLRDYEDICQEIEGCSTFEQKERVEELKQKYEELKELPPEFEEIIERRYKSAVDNWEHLITTAKEKVERRPELINKLNELILAQFRLHGEKKLLPFRKELEKIQKSWQKTSSELDDIEELTVSFEGTTQKINVRLEQEQKDARQAIEDLEKITQELNTLLEESPEKFREHRASIEETRDNALEQADPNNNKIKELENEIRRLLRANNERLTLHYQTLDLARWESYTLKLDLLKELEQLQDFSDDNLFPIAKRLGQIRQRWQDLGAVPYEKQEEIGPKFYDLTTNLQNKVDELFKERRENQSEAATLKEKFCEQAEEMSTSTEWNKTTKDFITLQEEWKKAPHSGRKNEQRLYKRFRTACDVFFNARDEFRKERNKRFDEIAKIKTQLCDEAEALTEKSVSDAVADARDLRTKFQEAGHAGRAERAISNRFNAAMDKVFDARREKFQEVIDQYEALVVEMENVSLDDPFSAQNIVDQNRKKWATLPHAPRAPIAKLEARARVITKKIETAVKEALKDQEAKREKLFIPALRELAKQIEARRSGETMPELTIDLSPLPRLAEMATELASTSGELPDNIKKALDKNTEDFTSHLEELEEIIAEENVEVDLAAELTAAITGNFAKGEIKVKEVSPEDIYRRLLNTGLPHPECLEALITRLEKLNL